MSLTREEEFIRKMEFAKNGDYIEGHDTNIMQLCWNLKRQAKEYFPMNEVPLSIIYSLESLEDALKTAEFQLEMTLDTIIYEVKKIDGLEDE